MLSLFLMQGGGHIVVSLVISETTEVEIVLFKCISFSENQQAPLTPPLPTLLQFCTICP